MQLGDCGSFGRTVSHDVSLRLNLTDQGLENMNKVLEATMSYLRFLANQLRGQQKFYLFDEI
jgi:secreted Zn-dependent insulinase-like peptidase